MTTGDKVLAYLASYGLKSEGTGKYRSRSPLRTNSDSLSFTLKIDADGEHGAFDDKAGGESGSLYDLAQRLNIPLPERDGERVAVADSRIAYKDLAEYAAFKGVPVEIFKHAKWSEQPVRFDGRPALEFPTANGKRYRFIDGNKPKFKSQTGFKACWYGLKPAAAFAKANKLPLVLCNGEPSVIVGLHYKVAACAVSGGEQPTLPAALLEELKAAWSGVIAIALDCDEAGRRSADGKAQILRAAGYTVHVLDLGLGEKGDLADFCKLHTDQTMTALNALIQKAAQQPQPAAPVSDLAALLNDLKVARKKNDAASQQSLPKLLDQIQAEIDKSRLTSQPEIVQSFAQLVKVRHARLDKARLNPNPIQGLRSGINKLDELFGGFVPGRVHTLYADTGMGKSTTVASVAAAFAGQAPGFVIPTENMPGDWLDKIAAFKAGVPYDCIETGIISDEQYRAVMATYGWLEEKQCHMLDNLSPTATTIGSAVRDGMKEFGYQWVIVDSVNNLSSLTHDDLYGKTSEAADFTQELARMGLVVIVTSQIGRNLKDRKNKIPKLDDAQGSGRVEQNSDVVATLYNHQYYVDREEAEPDPRFPPGLMFVRCLKHRWRGGQVNRSTFLTFKGGIGVYD